LPPIFIEEKIMKKYKEIKIKNKKLESIICDVCEKEYLENDIEDGLEIQEFLNISIQGGYSSVFGDGNILEADICQHCSKKLFGKYLKEV
jgi:hypothetical protein